MFGQVTNEKNKNLKDLSTREIIVLLPVLLFIIWIGVYPNTFLDKTKASSANFVALMEKSKATKVAAADVIIKGDQR
jgi:NADH-quinone oxidoreductase subunit M